MCETIKHIWRKRFGRGLDSNLALNDVVVNVDNARKLIQYNTWAMVSRDEVKRETVEIYP